MQISINEIQEKYDWEESEQTRTAKTLDEIGKNPEEQISDQSRENTR
jgi:hypothetical protein